MVFVSCDDHILHVYYSINIHTPPIVSSDIFTSGGSWLAGGIIVGLVNGVTMMMMIWGLVAVIRKRRRNANLKRNDER